MVSHTGQVANGLDGTFIPAANAAAVDILQLVRECLLLVGVLEILLAKLTDRGPLHKENKCHSAYARK